MEFIYSAKGKSSKLKKTQRVSFGELGVRERQHLEGWIADKPDILGEKLLVIATEFSEISKSARRVDILAMDKTGTLVIVEIKLDIRGSHADLQAIRYAALFRDMKMDAVVARLALYERISEEKARTRIEDFLAESDDEPLSKPPRIVLVAGSFGDRELTRSVLWLKEFGLDISCVEVTPYRLPGHHLVLVPSIVVPSAGRGTTEKVPPSGRKRRSQSRYAPLWQNITERFNRLNLKVGGRPFSATGTGWRYYFKVYLGHSRVHYEWKIMKVRRQLLVALHFEEHDRKANMRWLRIIQKHKKQISHGVKVPFETTEWGEKWATAQFLLPFSGREGDVKVAPRAVRTMKLLIKRTWPILEPVLNG